MEPGSWTAAAKMPFVTARKAFLSPGPAVIKKERDVVRENKGRRNVSDEQFGVEMGCPLSQQEKPFSHLDRL